MINRNVIEIIYYDENGNKHTARVENVLPFNFNVSEQALMFKFQVEVLAEILIENSIKGQA